MLIDMETESTEDTETHLKQTFIINTDLKMGAGKIAVQVGHGAVLYTEYVYDRYGSKYQQVNGSVRDSAYRHVDTDIILSRYIHWRACEVKPIGIVNGSRI